MKLFFLFSVLSFNLWAEIPQKAEIDNLFVEWDKPHVPGAALGIIQDGKLIYTRGYGMANLEYGIPINSKSVFRIGSTSKQFTAACIILLAQKNKLKLSDTLDKFFPDFPSYAKDITVQHLLNHTSGIRDYFTLADLKGLRADDYFDDDDLMHWLESQQSLNFKPGEEFSYTNSGYWLLGQIVNKVAEMNMAEFARKEIFKPLGMINTHFHNDHNHIVKNRASGYYPKDNDNFRINMTTLNMIGDGGIFTTIEDILLWDNAFYQSTVLNTEFWDLMLKKTQLNNSKMINYASGLAISEYKGLKSIHHAGAFAGFKSQLLRFPDHHTSIVLFANRGDTSPGDMASKVADIILKDKFVENPPIKPQLNNDINSIDAKVYSLTQLIGQYQVRPGVVLDFAIKDDILHAHQSWNDKNYNLKRIHGNMYQIPDDATISFTFAELNDNSAQLLIVNQNGEDSEWTRKITADNSKIDLNDYVGKYHSQELDRTMDLYLKDKQLFLTINSKEQGNLSIEVMDKFIIKNVEFVFERKDNKVIGFSINADDIRNLKAEKL